MELSEEKDSMDNGSEFSTFGILLRVISETRRFLEHLEEEELSANSEHTRSHLYELLKLINIKCELWDDLEENGTPSGEGDTENQNYEFEEDANTDMEGVKTCCCDCHKNFVQNGRFQTRMSVSRRTDEGATYSTFDMCSRLKPVALFRTELNFATNCFDVGPLQDSQNDVVEWEVTSDCEEGVSSQLLILPPGFPSDDLEKAQSVDENENAELFVISEKSPEERLKSLSRDLIKGLRSYLKMNVRGTLDASMVDLIQPDLSGWLLDDSDKKRKWCVVTDMLLCVFENEKSNSAAEVFVLPACTVRELYFRSSAPGSTRKFQIVVTSTSCEKEAVLSAETIYHHRKWLATLQNAIQHSTDIYYDSEAESDADTDSANGSMGSGCYPSPVKVQTVSSRYDPTAPGSVTRDDRLHRKPVSGPRDLFLKTDRVSAESPISSSENELDGGKRGPSTSEDSEEEDMPSALPNSKPNASPLPRRRISYLLATEHQTETPTLNKPRGLMDKIQTKTPKGLTVLKSSRPNVSRKNGGLKVKDPRKVKVKLESLKDPNLATYLRYKDNGKVAKMWCVICEHNLYSFKTKNHSERCDLCLDLDVSDVLVTNKSEFEFRVRFDGTEYTFCAQDRYDFSRWLRELLPGSDVTVPNVALSSALRLSSGSFCLDEEIKKSLEDLVDLRINLENGINSDSTLDVVVNRPKANSESKLNSESQKSEKRAKPWRRKSSKEDSSSDERLQTGQNRLSLVCDVTPNVPELPVTTPEAEALAYSAASEGSSDDDDIIIGLNTSRDSSNTSRDSGHLSDSTSSLRLHSGHVFPPPRPSMERRSGSVDVPLRRNMPVSVVRRHFTDQNMANGATPKLMTCSAESVITGNRLHKIQVGYHDRGLIRAGSLDTELSSGILRCASSDRLQLRRSSHHRIQGEVQVSVEDGVWHRVWAIFDEHTLCLYPDRSSTHPDTLLDIPRCSLEMQQPGNKEDKDCIKITPLGKSSILLSAEEATRRWYDIMHDDVTKLAYEGLNLEDSYSREFQHDSKLLQEEEKKRRFKEELAQLKKEQLLSELLQQKRDLEQKQAERNQTKSKKQSNGESQLPNKENTKRQDIHLPVTDESQVVRDITHLQQRRISTQIKVDRISKQLLESNKKQEKRFTFRFALNKKDNNESNRHSKDHLESHLKELTDKLETIEENLSRTQVTKEKLQKRAEAKQLHDSYSAGDFQRLSALDALLEANLDPLSQSCSGSLPGRTRAATDPVEGVTRRSYDPTRRSRAKNRLSEPPRPKPKIEINPSALAEIEEFEKMTKMYLGKQPGDGFRV